MSLVPSVLPVRVAAAICGRSEPTFRRTALPLIGTTVEGRVSLAGLARYLDREISADRYLSAVRSLEGRRARERRYKAAEGHAA